MERLRTSGDEQERDSVWLGWVDNDGSPILWPLKKLCQHAWLVGKTGSGKSAYLMALINQLIVRFGVSVVFIDAKATSNEVLATMLRASKVAEKRVGKRIGVQHFKLDDGYETFSFNIFRQSWWGSLSSTQRAGVILSALALLYSRAYGRSFFTDANFKFTHFVIRRHPDVKSWGELRDRMYEARRSARPFELSDHAKKSGEHISYCVERLADIPSLNHPGQTIDFGEAFGSTPHHYYIDVGGIRNPLIGGEVGRLFTSAVVNAAAGMQHRKTPVILVIDEWQQLITEHLEVLLSHADRHLS